MNKKKFKLKKNTTCLKYKSMLMLLDISEICSMIQKLNSYNLMTDKVAEKVP